MYFIELLTTRKCNQKCYYCTTYSSGDVTVDIDYLKWVLDQLPSETGVELTGGEVGLVKNIDEVYKTIKNHSSIKHIMVMSNGLLRTREIDWIKDVEYWEHLIYEVDGKTIKRFYDLDLEQDHRYVIVTTETTTKSLLANWKWFEGIGIFRPNFFYKLMNHKASSDIRNYWNDLFELYKRLDNRYFLKMLVHFLDNSVLINEKILCQRWSPNPFVDLQTHELGHCAINVEQSLKDKFNKDNLMRMMEGVNENTYCVKCYSFDNGKNRSILNNRSYKR